MVPRALRSSLPTSSNCKCFGDLTTEVRGTLVGSVEMLWVFLFFVGFFFFYPLGNLWTWSFRTQESWGLFVCFFLFSLSLCACAFGWLMKLFMVSKASGKAVWPVRHGLDENGDIQLLVPCSRWVFYRNWVMGLLQRTFSCSHRLCEGFQQLSCFLPLCEQLSWMPEEQLSLVKGLALWTGSQ